MKLRLESGEEALATKFDGNILMLLSPRAFAPGSPIRLTATSDSGERNLEGRVLGSRRVRDQQFEVRIRFVNLRRATRELLVENLG